MLVFHRNEIIVKNTIEIIGMMQKV